MYRLTVENNWHNNVWKVNEHVVSFSDIHTVRIKKLIFQVIWKPEDGKYEDHGHTYPYHTMNAFIKEPTFNVLIPLKDIMKRYKVGVVN